MSSRLKQRAGMLVAGAAMSVFTLTGFTGVAQAQNLLDSSVSVDEQIGDVVGVESDTLATESVAAQPGQPLVGGAVDNSTEGAAPAAPVQGNVAVDALVAVEGVVEQDVCLNAGVNASAGECGSPVSEPPSTPDPVAEVVDGNVDGAVQVNEPLVPAQSGTDLVADASVAPVAAADVCLGLGINQATEECNAPTAPATPAPTGVAPITGDVDAGVGAEVPLPVDTGATLDTGAVVDELAIADICVNAGVNQQPGTCGRTTPGNGGMPDAGLVDGDVDGVVEANAPLPVDGNASADTDAALGDLVDAAGICLDVGINQEADNCADEGSGGSGGSPVSNTDVVNEVEVNAPLPVDTGTGSDTGVVVDDIADAGVCLGVGVNRDSSNCDGAGSGSGDPGNGDGQPGEDPIVDGNVDSGTDVNVPLPGDSGTEVDIGAVVDDVADVEACVGLGINQESGACRESASDTPDDDEDGNNTGDGVNIGGDTGGGDGNSGDSGNSGDDEGSASFSDGDKTGDGGNSVDTGGGGNSRDIGGDGSGTFGGVDAGDPGSSTGGSGSGGFASMDDPDDGVSSSDAIGSQDAADGLGDGAVSSGETVLTSTRTLLAAADTGSGDGDEGGTGADEGGAGAAEVSGQAVAGELPDTGGLPLPLLSLIGALFLGLGICGLVAASRRRRTL